MDENNCWVFFVGHVDYFYFLLFFYFFLIQMYYYERQKKQISKPDILNKGGIDELLQRKPTLSWVADFASE